MKNKQAKQLRDRQIHREQLRNNRKKAPNLERLEGNRLIKPTILIVCEGMNTEPSYFNQFRLPSATVTTVGEGYNTVSLVNRALALSKERHYD